MSLQAVIYEADVSFLRRCGCTSTDDLSIKLRGRVWVFSSDEVSVSITGAVQPQRGEESPTYGYTEKIS